MTRCVALAPAYPPLSGDPLAFSAAPLLITTTLLPGRSGFSSASRSHWNVIRTSVSQLTENVSHVWCCSGRMLWECTGHQNDDLRLVSVEEAGCHCRATGIGDLELDGGRPVGPLGKRRRSARN